VFLNPLKTSHASCIVEGIHLLAVMERNNTWIADKTDLKLSPLHKSIDVLSHAMQYMYLTLGLC
jgi:hypothetical protein